MRGGLHLSDSIDLDFDWRPLSDPNAELHLPYVTGTSVNIHVHGGAGQEQDEDAPRWRLESSDPTVLRIDSQDGDSARCTALAEGRIEMRVFEDDSLVLSNDLGVRDPSRAELHAHGPLRVGLGEDVARTGEEAVKIVAGGTATFLVRYYDGDTRLYGNGALEAVAAGALEVEPRRSFLFENREWFSVTPQREGSSRADLSVAGVAVASLAVQGVSAAEVDFIELIKESDVGASEGEQLCVLAQAHDAEGVPVYGAEFTWQIDGLEEEGEGDLFRYGFSGMSSELGADFDGLEAEVVIQGHEGVVSSSNNIGCSLDPTRFTTGRGLPAGACVLVLLGLFIVRRGRRRMCSVR